MELLAIIAMNWDNILIALGAVHTLAVFIVNLTPSETDNEVVKKVFRVAELFSGLLTKAARQNVIK